MAKADLHRPRLRQRARGTRVSRAHGDFDGDGIADLALADRFASGVALQLGDASGRYRAVSVKPAAAVLADFDRDGAVDLAYIDGEDRHVFITLHWQGTARSQARVPLAGKPSAIALGDFNGDGVADVAVASRAPDGVAVLIGDGLGGFSARAPVRLERSPLALAVGDFNDDGIADIAVADAEGACLILGSRRGRYRINGQQRF